jgi:serine/threonine protein kinase
LTGCNCSSGKHDSKDSLSWEKRNKIAIGIAKALEYLHHGSVTQSVIHGDVKSSNILLSEDFQAQVNNHKRFANTEIPEAIIVFSSYSKYFFQIKASALMR